jgi:preprotein translocase subunit SecG
MYQVIIVIHVLLGLGIIGLILMQQGKGADAGAAFGTGSAGSVFGAQGAASFLSRATAILATLFFITSLGLAVINGHKGAAFDLITGSGENEGVAEVAVQKELNSQAEVPSVPEVKLTPEVKADAPVPSAEIKNTEVPKAEKLKTIGEGK